MGVAQLFAREGTDPRPADNLRRIRGLTGSGLTLDELAALSAPWFLDRSYLQDYTAANSAHNAALGSAIGRASAVFEDRSHPSSLASAHAKRLSARCACAAAMAPLTAGCSKSSMPRSSGGSDATDGPFGFRGHRYEVIEPEREDGVPFLRVALGFREGPTLRG